MAEKNRFSKPVAFNKTVVEDQKILKHVERRNFSGYVKKLILADIEKGEGTKRENETIETVKIDIQKPMSAAERLAVLKEKQKRPGISEPTHFIQEKS